MIPEGMARACRGHVHMPSGRMGNIALIQLTGGQNVPRCGAETRMREAEKDASGVLWGKCRRCCGCKRM